MRRLVAYGIVGLILLYSGDVCAQAKDTILQEHKVKGRHKISKDDRINDFSPGQKVTTIDTAVLRQYHLQSMAGLLAQQVPAFVKSYGFSGLATLNFRGSSAAQSQVFWNGVPIQNAALGIADISALPVALANNVSVVYGGSAALWGSGNVGGALLLETETPRFDSGWNKIAISVGAGSFGQSMGGLKGAVSNSRWYLSGNIFLQQAKDDFTYPNGAAAKQHLLNDELKSAAAIVQAAYKITERQVVSLSGWYQQYDRQIPPAMFESFSEKLQKDRSLRLLADWRLRSGGNSWYAKSSLVRDEVQYNDPAVVLTTSNAVYQYYQEVGWKRRMSDNGQLLLFAPIQASWISLVDGTKYQRKTALAGAYDVKLVDQRLDIAVNARAEAIDQQRIFLPGADAGFIVTGWLTIRANVQKTFRAPTLNELYNDPGGNANLKPEQGWNEDAGYTVKFKAGRLSFHHDASIFNRDIHDWILWLGGAIWTPHNIAEVHSRGTETENYVSYSLGNWSVHLGINTAYVIATAVASYLPNDGSIGKQIPYTPRYNGQANAGFTFRKFSFNYNHTYTGYRFLTSDESEYLPPYETGNIQLTYGIQRRQYLVQLTAQCNNIWNEQYQVVAFRPMPGVNWLAGVSIRR